MAAVGWKGLAVAVALVSAMAAQDVVTVTGGKIRGATADGVRSFKGVPYAQPPVGELRWRAPLPVKPWDGVRGATAYGHDCMQLPFPSDAAPLGTEPAEDCLVVNVWRPAGKATGLPVMVWIYGGGYVNGGSSPAVYDGSQFARQGMVFVSFNYRLGRFGFFAHPALTAEASGGPTGNFALLDQIAVLKWVQANVAAFGGDAGKVTLFGESAGGGSVLAMLTSPLAHGLFQQAAIESGGGRSGLGGMPYLSKPGENGRPSAEDVGVAFAKAKGIDGTGPDALKALRALPAEQVVDGLNMASMGTARGTYSGPMIDGQVVVETPQAAFAAAHAMKVPVLVGANGMDIGFSGAKTTDELFAEFGAKKDEARKAYDPDGTENLRKLAQMVAADRMMDEPARFVARQVTAEGEPAYLYRFSYVAASMQKEWAAAPHATEIPYVFDTVKAKYGAALTPEDAAMGRAANRYWGAFVKMGAPEVEGLPAWPKYDPARDVLMEFTEKGPVAEADPWKARLDLTEGAVTRP